MAYDDRVDLPVSSSWTLITDDDVSSITFMNIGNASVEIKVGTSSTLPADTVYGIPYPPREGERNVALTDLAPGVSSGVRVFARSTGGSQVWVSHA